MTTQEILQKAHEAKYSVSNCTTEERKNALLAMAKALRTNEKDILEANVQDLTEAKGKTTDVMLDRLTLTCERIEGMAQGIEKVASLPDPTGKVLEQRQLDNGLFLTKVSVPIGVVAMIYESRPNVTSDAAALTIMSGNVCVLRGGKEAIKTNLAIAKALKQGLVECGITEDAIGMIEDPTRASATELMEAIGLVDLLIPRGSAGLIQACVQNSKVPCIQTGAGICHIYVDKDADLEKALAIVDNAKTSRPSVCNAAEVCLVHKDIAASFLPKLYNRFVNDRKKAKKQPVELRLDDKAAEIISGTKAGPADFDTEFLNYIMAIYIVSSVDEAVAHIQKHSTGHSEAIISENNLACARFAAGIDSSAIYINASTRFTDGGEYGFGCEIGISTQKLHVRGPMGLEALTSYKYILKGNGQTR